MIEAGNFKKHYNLFYPVPKYQEFFKWVLVNILEAAGLYIVLLCTGTCKS